MSICKKILVTTNSDLFNMNYSAKYPNKSVQRWPEKTAKNEYLKGIFNKAFQSIVHENGCTLDTVSDSVEFKDIPTIFVRDRPLDVKIRSYLYSMYDLRVNMFSSSFDKNINSANAGEERDTRIFEVGVSGVLIFLDKSSSVESLVESLSLEENSLDKSLEHSVKKMSLKDEKNDGLDLIKYLAFKYKVPLKIVTVTDSKVIYSDSYPVLYKPQLKEEFWIDDIPKTSDGKYYNIKDFKKGYYESIKNKIKMIESDDEEEVKIQKSQKRKCIVLSKAQNKKNIMNKRKNSYDDDMPSRRRNASEEDY